jgi:hypothetical protein
MKDLWKSILAYAYLKFSQPVIESMQQTFADNKISLDEFLTKMFGVLEQEERRSVLDRQFGDMVISLYQNVQAYDEKSMEQLNVLIHFASTMEKSMLHLESRLRRLLHNSKFAHKLYKLIYSLGFPERAYSTFVQAAQKCQCFGHVTFHPQAGMSSPNRIRSAAPVPTSSTATHLPETKIKSPTSDAKSNGHSASSSSTTRKSSITTSTGTPRKRSEKRPPPPSPPHKAPPKSQQSDGLSPPMSKPKAQCDMNNILRQYLSEEDLLQGLAWLEPASKQHTAELIVYLLCDQQPPPTSHAWYVFGFVTTRDKDEKSYLAGTYHKLLEEAQDKKSIFRELTHAVQNNTLVQLFEVKEYGHIQELCPHLEAFLNTPPSRRSSTFRLRQFLHSESTEPLAILRRDFGFKYCIHREEVTRLKAIYTKVLETANLMALHIACINGRLHEFAMQNGVCVDAKDRRLMQNDYPNPCIGYDDDAGLAAFTKPLFKKSL